MTDQYSVVCDRIFCDLLNALEETSLSLEKVGLSVSLSPNGKMDIDPTLVEELREHGWCNINESSDEDEDEDAKRWLSEMKTPTNWKM